MIATCHLCDNGITNSDFITCAGFCGEQFHLKCVSVTKAMLRSVTNCPNIQWLCDDCNNGNRNDSSTVNCIEDAMNLLMSSLCGDLLKFLNGFKALMDNLFGRINITNSVWKESNVVDSMNEQSSEAKENEKGEIVHDQAKSEVSYKPKVSRHIHVMGHKSSKSVVVSNIGNDVTMDHLRNYLLDRLGIEKDEIQLELLLPTGRTVPDMNYLQYKITIPNSTYSSIMSSDTWPKFVRVRDFVYKRRSDIGVSSQSFALK